MDLESTPDGRHPRPIRLRDRVFVPPAPRNTAVITGHPARTPERLLVDVPDPRSGRSTPLAVWHYPATTGDPGRPLPPIVMVHGFRGDHHGLALLADCLPEREIYLPELPGFGHSPAFPDATHTVDHYAAAVGSALRSLGLVPVAAGERPSAVPPEGSARPVLLGHSFGSVVASRLASADPTPWAGLVLVNPICEPTLAAEGSPVERALTRLTQAYYEAAAALPLRAGQALLSSPAVVWFTGTLLTKTQDLQALAYLHDQHQSYFSAFDGRRTLVEAYRASITSSVLDHADGLALPVLLIAGAQDELGSVAGQERLAARIGGASPEVTLEVLDGVGHLIHYERAPEAARLVRRFTDSLAGTPGTAPTGPLPR
ncbi:alpha/beta hydrolase [Citricoccus sp. SGAir0253]|nr:alpha/beta hydrolase [Citricoccus sp. SGAir0253]